MSHRLRTWSHVVTIVAPNLPVELITASAQEKEIMSQAVEATSPPTQ